MTLHARFVKNSQALLSPAFEPSGSATHYCFIEFLSFQPQPASSSLGQARLADYVSFVEEIGAQEIDLDGRPHWAKLFQDVPGGVPYVFQASAAPPRAETWRSSRRYGKSTIRAGSSSATSWSGC